MCTCSARAPRALGNPREGGHHCSGQLAAVGDGDGLPGLACVAQCRSASDGTCTACSVHAHSVQSLDTCTAMHCAQAGSPVAQAHPHQAGLQLQQAWSRDAS